MQIIFIRQIPAHSSLWHFLFISKGWSLSLSGFSTWTIATPLLNDLAFSVGRAKTATCPVCRLLTFAKVSSWATGPLSCREKIPQYYNKYGCEPTLKNTGTLISTARWRIQPEPQQPQSCSHSWWTEPVCFWWWVEASWNWASNPWLTCCEATSLLFFSKPKFVLGCCVFPKNVINKAKYEN